MTIESTTFYSGPLFTDTEYSIKRKVLMLSSPKHILAAIALILSVASFLWPLPWQIPAILLAIAIFLP